LGASSLKIPSARLPLDFPAGCLRNTSDFQKLDGMNLKLKFLIDSLTDRGCDVFKLRRRETAILPINLMADDERLDTIRFDGKRSTVSGTQCGMRFFYDSFDVLRIVICTANDDQVFKPACNKELARGEKAEIPRPEKRTLIRVC